MIDDNDSEQRREGERKEGDVLEHVLGSNAERDRAVERLGRDLARLAPVERLNVEDLLSLAVGERVAELLKHAPADLPPRSEWERQQAAAERAQRLHDAGVEDALTEQDLEWLVRDGAPPSRRARCGACGDGKRSGARA